MRLAGVISDSIVDGPGMRYVVFTQGCPHGCPGCHNPATHSPDGGCEISTDEMIAALEREVEEDPLLDGVTLSGGEPFEQASELKTFAARVRELGLDLWIYTGWTLEEIARRADPDELELLSCANALVDGRYVEALRTLETRFVGSSNQRIIKDPATKIRG